MAAAVPRHFPLATMLHLQLARHLPHQPSAETLARSPYYRLPVVIAPWSPLSSPIWRYTSSSSRRKLEDTSY